MNEPNNCPFCASPAVVAGHVRTAKGLFGFLPLEIRKGMNLTTRGVFAFNFGPEANYCAHCNMVWSKASARDAADFIRKHGNEGLKAQFEAAQPTPAPPA